MVRPRHDHGCVGEQPLLDRPHLHLGGGDAQPVPRVRGQEHVPPLDVHLHPLRGERGVALVGEKDRDTAGKETASCDGRWSGKATRRERLTGGRAHGVTRAG